MISGPTWQSLIFPGFWPIFFRSISMMPEHGAGQPDDAREIQEQVLAIGPIGHVEQLLAELLDGQLVENAMLAEADHQHGALFAKAQVMARRAAAALARCFRPAGETSIRRATCGRAGSRHGQPR